MKQNNNYVLKRIARVPYLLPVGQMIGDLRHGIQINETGAYLWKLLKKERTLEELVQLCAKHYAVSHDKLPRLKNDILQFISSLAAQDVLVPAKTTSDIKSPFYKCVEIAGLKCDLYGSKEAFSESFDAFTCDFSADCAQSIEVLTELPQTFENGKLLLRNHELTVIECADKYVLLFPSSGQILETHLTKDASLARFYCIPPLTDSLRNDLFHAIRLVYLYLAQRHGMIVLHSASILYRGRAWLFSAASGTGKSTHTNLWNSLLGVPIINGDLNLLAVADGQAVIHGLPWCGSSGIFDTHTYPLGGIILLKQAPENYVESLPEDKKRLLVLQRLISPSWTGQLLDRSLKAVDALAEKILICRLLCTPQASAVEVIKQQIDGYLEEHPHHD